MALKVLPRVLWCLPVWFVELFVLTDLNVFLSFVDHEWAQGIPDHSHIELGSMSDWHALFSHRPGNFTTSDEFRIILNIQQGSEIRPFKNRIYSKTGRFWDRLWMVKTTLYRFIYKMYFLYRKQSRLIYHSKTRSRSTIQNLDMSGSRIPTVILLIVHVVQCLFVFIKIFKVLVTFITFTL